VQGAVEAINQRRVRGDGCRPRRELTGAGRRTQSDRPRKKLNLEKAKSWTMTRGQGLFKDGMIPKQDSIKQKTPRWGPVRSRSARSRVQSLKSAIGSELGAKGKVHGPARWGGVVAELRCLAEEHLTQSPHQWDRELVSPRKRRGEYVVPGIQNSNGIF